MEVRLRHIGIVEDSLIKIDGLTIITGKNNSGKTTVGKALYSLLDAVCNLEYKVLRDRKAFIRKQLDTLVAISSVFRLYNQLYHRMPRENDLYPSIRALFLEAWHIKQNNRNVEEFAKKVMEELERFDVKTAVNDNQFVRLYERLYDKKNGKDNLMVSLQEERDRAIAFLTEMFKAIDQDPEKKNYVRESINQTLSKEFSNQIQPAAGCESISLIELLSDTATHFRVTVDNNRVVECSYSGSPFKNTFLIDDPFVVDDQPVFDIHGTEATEIDSVLNRDAIIDHRTKLRKILHSKSQPSVLEQTVLDYALSTVFERLNCVLPGSFQYQADDAYYVNKGAKLKVSNLATGSKMFSILKLLLEKGELGESTMLILDEPEAHLHPKWQNSFAEIIVLLVKELKMKVLLTTHSSNFVLALDAYMRKYQVNDIVNFYQTVEHQNGFVDYECVNNSIDVIYQDFLEYLSEAKALRDKYLFGHYYDE